MNVTQIPEIIADLRDGKMVIIADDESRENECDLLMAADKVTPEAINFMSMYGRGLICLALSRERCQTLNLPLMVSTTDTRFATNFTLSIDANSGITTGISAQDRAHTICQAIASNAKPSDIIRPGHIFPLMSQPGGVLTRAGHTEAGCDLARLAGFESAAVIVEILNDDGTMARRKDIGIFAKKHNLKIGTVEDLIRYSLHRERTVYREQEVPVKTDHGEFTLYVYVDKVNKTQHTALLRGRPQSHRPTLVRVHVENSLFDTLGVQNEGGSWAISDAMQYIADAEEGVLVLLRLPEHLIQQVESIDDGVEHATTYDRWQIGVGGQILQDLGIGKMRVMSSQRSFHGLGGFGLSIEEYICKPTQ